MKIALFTFTSLLVLAGNARAELPMGLKCESKIKIVEAEVGEVGSYDVQMGMKKETHTAFLKRAKVKPTDGCHFPTLAVGKTVVVKYSGAELGETEVQCIDQNNKNELVTFPKSIYTVRRLNIETYKLNPYCPDGKPTDGVPCSKLDSQSQRGMDYKAKVLGWGGNGQPESKKKLYLVDLTFDPPYRNSVPAGAKLFCALVTRDGKVAIAGTAVYPGVDAEPKPADAAE